MDLRHESCAFPLRMNEVRYTCRNHLDPPLMIFI